jgi:hypothetical protein
MQQTAKLKSIGQPQQATLATDERERTCELQNQAFCLSTTSAQSLSEKPQY